LPGSCAEWFGNKGGEIKEANEGTEKQGQEYQRCQEVNASLSLPLPSHFMYCVYLLIPSVIVRFENRVFSYRQFV
jgi:hypothetical protein